MAPTDWKDFADWCDAERAKLGGVDGYNYVSGEEYGLRRAQIEAERRAALATIPSPAGAEASKEQELPYRCDVCCTPGYYAKNAKCLCDPAPLAEAVVKPLEDVQRFQMKSEHVWICARPDEKGDWVRYSDVAALVAPASLPDGWVDEAVKEAEIEWSYHEDDDRYPREFWHARIVWRDLYSDWTREGEQEKRDLPPDLKARAEERLRAELRHALAARPAAPANAKGGE